MAKTKLKGCRTTKECDEDYYRTSAQLGDCVGGIAAIHQTKQKLLKRQEEIRIERAAAEQQEMAIAAKEKADKESIPDAPTPPASEAAHVQMQ